MKFKKINIEINPNPSNGRFTIKLDQKKKGKIIVNNLLGFKVYELETELIDSLELDLKNLKKDLYILSILLEDDQIISKRIIIY